ncbi:MAG: excinuclease ABC subunit UvrC [Planctomycetes bacterium]|nr:excinuclease ABC subunit UvrC [Planctomycetota bacterium]
MLDSSSPSSAAGPDLDQQIAQLPAEPGVYLMKDARNEVLYIGKAKNLRARVRSYFLADSAGDRPFLRLLTPRVARIDHVVTAQESEALLLENNLIKQFKPRFNINLKDDKTYVSLKIDMTHDFPRPVIVRRREKEKSVLYFGPYASASSVRSTLRYLNRLFPIRECSDHVLSHRTRPCPLYDMGRCSAPCVGLISREAYHELVQEVILVLRGHSEELIERLNGKMTTAARALRFEEAARLRDQIRAVQHTAERQRVDVPDFVDRDVFAYHVQGEFMEIQGMFVRHGRLEDLSNFGFKTTDRRPEEVFASFLNLFYTEVRMIPDAILLPIEVEDAAALAQWLSEQRGKKAEILCPRRGHGAQLVELARLNAVQAYQTRHGAPEANRQILQALQKDLGLANLPSRIECFDISNIGGHLAVGSMVTFIECGPDKKRYRHYKIRTVEQSDDFAMMSEVLRRRFTRGLEENDLPDLVVIDGGKGQLAAARRVLEELGVHRGDLIALAKRRRRGRPGGRTVVLDERVFTLDREAPVVLPQSSPHLLYLTRIRDEAHRFAVAYHRNLRQKEYHHSALAAIPGVGEVLRRRLLRHFGSVQAVRDAPAEQLAFIPGISSRLAQTIYAHFHPNPATAAHEAQALHAREGP